MLDFNFYTTSRASVRYFKMHCAKNSKPRKGLLAKTISLLLCCVLPKIKLDIQISKEIIVFRKAPLRVSYWF